MSGMTVVDEIFCLWNTTCYLLINDFRSGSAWVFCLTKNVRKWNKVCTIMSYSSIWRSHRPKRNFVLINSHRSMGRLNCTRSNLGGNLAFRLRSYTGQLYRRFYRYRAYLRFKNNAKVRKNNRNCLYMYSSLFAYNFELGFDDFQSIKFKNKL
jgi:hypothetical protein